MFGEQHQQRDERRGESAGRDIAWIGEDVGWVYGDFGAEMEPVREGSLENAGMMMEV